MHKKCFGSCCVELTSLEKVLFPEQNITKSDLIAYYTKVASFLVPYTKDRLLSMRQFPEGISHPGFFHKDAPDYFPSWIRRKLVKRQGAAGSVHYVVCDSSACLVYLAQNYCIELHVSLSRVDTLHYPDQMIFDIDPSTNNDFVSVKKVAIVLKEELERVGLIAFVKLTGSRGLHVVVPLRRIDRFDKVRLFSHYIAQNVLNRVPDLVTLEIRKEKRNGRIFLDTLRNSFSATVIAPYSVRALAHAPVAAPLLWDELNDDLVCAQPYTLSNIFKRLDCVGDVWRGMGRRARRLPDLL